jgi:hypothetical protein
MGSVGKPAEPSLFMIKRRERPRELGLAAKIAGIKTKAATKPKRLGKRAKPRKLGLGARAAAIREGQQDKTEPAAHQNSYRKRKLWPDYKAFLASKVCAIPGCGRTEVQVSHVGPRGMSQKADCRWCLPFCYELHHEEGPESHHVLGRRFWKHHSVNRDELVQWYNLIYAALDKNFEPLRFPLASF